jgi:serine protease Do
MNPTLRKLAVPGALVLGLGTAATAVEAVRTAIAPADAQQAPAGPTRVAEPTGEALSLATAFRAASRAAFPAVVHIRAEGQARQVAMNGLPPQLRGTPFEDLFRGEGGERTMRMPPSQSSGSGFVLSADGYILTNNHVVADASRVTVVFTDKREFEARVVGRDPNTDVAVLKIEGSGLPVARIGDSDALQTGDWVLALGYPLSLGETTTAGIVSAKGKDIGIMDRNEGATAPLEHFIQTDAVINPGNSGGPLIDLQGRVVGMNTAIASQTGFYAGYGFAVPIGLAKRVADDLIQHGRVRRPIIGVSIRDVSAADREVFRLPDTRGVVVATEPSGPAREAGIRMGDVIVAVDGVAVQDRGDLMERIARRQPGDEVKLDLVRYGSRQRVEVKLGTLQADRVSQAADEGGAGEGRPSTATADKLGFTVRYLDAAAARNAELKYDGGVVVWSVEPGSPAAQVLGRGFRIEKVNGRDVRTVADLDAAARDLRPGQVVSVVGRGPDGTQTIANFRLRS